MEATKIKRKWENLKQKYKVSQCFLKSRDFKMDLIIPYSKILKDFLLLAGSSFLLHFKWLVNAEFKRCKEH